MPFRSEPIPAVEDISTAIAGDLVKAVAKQGGELPDLMTALVLVNVKVLSASFADSRDTERAKLIGDQIASILPAFREVQSKRRSVMQ